jgi:NAD(P)-dependent dehydrogenase (short-subunit alcohol dehydrogenase family)
MRRLGHPDEIAHAVRFLLQDNAAYITGTVLSVNGGMEM